METNIDEIKEAWKQATDSDVTKATTKDWGEYSPAVQAVIESEAKKRGLWEKVLYLRGEKTNEPISNLEGYVCEGCKGTVLNFETGRCEKCELPSDSMGYCIECDKFWSIQPGQMCPEHGTKLSQHKAATSLLRLGNYIFDRLFIFPIAFAIIIIVVALGLANTDYFENMDSASDYAFTLVLFLLYFFVFEIMWQRTFGKFITGTKVVTIYGSKPTLGAIIIRTLARFIPFEAFSFLGNNVRGWHDTCSRTYVIKAKRFERKTVSQQSNDNLPQGIKGWLVVVAIGLIIYPILVANNLVLSILPAYGTNIWDSLTNVNSERYLPYFAHLLVFETLASIFLLIYSFLLLLYFFGKKKALPKLLIVFLCLWLVTFIFDQIGVYLIFPHKIFNAEGIGEFIGGMIWPLVSCSIWIPYFLKSKRVKNTFVFGAKSASNIEQADNSCKVNSTHVATYIEKELNKTVHNKYEPCVTSEPIDTKSRSEKTNTEAKPMTELEPIISGRLDKCANCDGIIGKLESSYNFKGNIICSRCYHKLKQE